MKAQIFKKNPSCLLLFCAHYFLVMILLLIWAGIIVTLIFANPEGPFQTTNLPFNKAEIPEYIVQVSDVHNCPAYPELEFHNTAIFKNISEKLNPNITILTGDLVEASITGSYFDHHKQYLENWIIFNRTLFNSGILRPDRLFIPLPGNHDLWAVDSDSAFSFPFRRFLMDDDSDIEVKLYETAKMDLLIFNPISFPMVTAPLGLIPFVQKSVLEKLERTMRNRTTVIISHFPHMRIWSSKTEKGNTIHDIIRKAPVFLTGHFHPVQTDITRFGNTLHLIALASSQSTLISVTTNDNNMFVTHEIDLSLESDAMITFPVPKNQSTGNVDFSKNDFDVRLILFSNQAQNLTLLIDDQIIGELEKVAEIRPNVSFYKHHVRVTNGDHTIKIVSKYLTKTVDFFVGESIPRTWHSISIMMISPKSIITFAVSCYLIAGLWVAPIWRIPVIRALLEELRSVLNGQSEISLSKLFIAGPLWNIARIRYANQKLYFVSVFLYLWVLIIPLYISPAEKKICAIFAWGLVSSNDIRFLWSYIFGLDLLHCFLLFTSDFSHWPAI